MPTENAKTGLERLSSGDGAGIATTHSTQKLDPQRLFELVSKNYSTWLQVMNKEFPEEDEYLPFPSDGGGKKSQPIFNYSLLEALEKASLDFSDRINKLEETEKVPEIGSSNSGANSREHAKLQQEYAQSLLQEPEISFLRNKISELVNNGANGIRGQSSNGLPQQEGFSLYDTRDEEGLHEGNTDQCYDQDDYDLDEVNDYENANDGKSYQYDYPSSHHIEVELNTVPECPEHGMDGCDCELYSDRPSSRYDDEGPSCEFTFEYDRNGKLVPTYSNVEEKLRLMSLQSQITGQNSESLRLPSISELDIGNSSVKAKKKKNKKKKGKTLVEDPVSDASRTDQSCLFCQYEMAYGEKPVQMMKWYDQRVRKDEQRRHEIKRKLETAKLNALKKQRELRSRQMHENSESPPPSRASPRPGSSNEGSDDECGHEHSHSHGHDDYDEHHAHAHTHDRQPQTA